MIVLIGAEQAHLAPLPTEERTKFSDNAASYVGFSAG
jgi:hypothetical protein